MRLRRLMATDCKLVTWKPDTVPRVISHAYHSDIMAAARYAHHGAYHYRGKAAPAELTLDQRRDKAFRDRARRESDPFNPWGARQ